MSNKRKRCDSALLQVEKVLRKSQNELEKIVTSLHEETTTENHQVSIATQTACDLDQVVSTGHCTFLELDHQTREAVQKDEWAKRWVAPLLNKVAMEEIRMQRLEKRLCQAYEKYPDAFAVVELQGTLKGDLSAEDQDGDGEVDWMFGDVTRQEYKWEIKSRKWNNNKKEFIETKDLQVPLRQLLEEELCNKMENAILKLRPKEDKMVFEEREVSTIAKIDLTMRVFLLHQDKNSDLFRLFFPSS